MTALRQLIQAHLSLESRTPLQAHTSLEATLEDLRIPPANRLEALAGNRKGQHSIRVNDQLRVCFKFNAGQVEDVEMVDYH